MMTLSGNDDGPDQPLQADFKTRMIAELRIGTAAVLPLKTDLGMMGQAGGRVGPISNSVGIYPVSVLEIGHVQLISGDINNAVERPAEDTGGIRGIIHARPVITAEIIFRPGRIRHLPMRTHLPDSLIAAFDTGKVAVLGRIIHQLRGYSGHR